MTTPPLTCPVVSCHAETHALTEHLYDHSAGVLAHTLAGAAAEFARLEEVIAKRDTALARARAERDRAERRQQPTEAENTPLTLVQLREAVIAAIAEDALRPHLDRLGLVDAMLTVVWPQLDAARRSARASEESTTILQRAWDAQAAEWDVARVERDEARQQLAAVAAQRDQLRAENDRLMAFIERGFDTHMQFGVINPDGTTEMLPCADWCNACKLAAVVSEAERLRAELEQTRQQLAEARGHAELFGRKLVAALDARTTD
jgi:DNA repair exonuclease SbcCD ATPase subunit